MKRVVRSTGIVVETPSHYDIDEAPGAVAARRRGARSGPVAAADDVTALLIDTMRDQNLVLVDQIPLAPSAEPGAHRRAAAAGEPGRLRIEVPLAAEDDAVVLVERDGGYSWVFPSDTPEVAAEHRRGAPGERRTRSFDIDLTGPDRAPARRGFFSDLILGRIRAVVFRFVARVAADRAMAFLERNVSRGLVTIQGDPSGWSPGMPPAAAAGTAPRTVLLFLHGTFSSTRGSFGALGVTAAGRAFLARAAERYDAVIGFDHPTLSIDPGANADDLIAALDDWRDGRPLRVDIVSYSRGGLVYRALVQRLDARTDISFGRVCYVAVPNAGTTLADAANWHQLLDLYTNLAMAGVRVLRLIPGADVVALIGREAISSLGAFVRYLTGYAIDEAGVPGLAAMKPGGAFLATLTAAGRETARYAVASNFEPDGLGDAEVAGLPRQVLVSVTDGVVDRLLGSDNDLVVNTASMIDFGAAAPVRLDEVLDFGTTSHVYHTTYFSRDEVANALLRWLGSDARDAVAAVRRLGAGAKAETAVPLLEVRESDDIVVLDAGEPLRRVFDLARPGGPEFAVVRRPDGDTGLHYALRPAELIRMVGARAIRDVLDLHETDASPLATAGVRPVPPVRRGGPASRFRIVIVDADQPVAVVHNEIGAIGSTLADEQVLVALHHAGGGRATFDVPLPRGPAIALEASRDTRITRDILADLITAPPDLVESILPGGDPTTGPAARGDRPARRSGPIETTIGAAIERSDPSPAAAGPPPERPDTADHDDEADVQSEPAARTAPDDRQTAATVHCHFLAELNKSIPVGDESTLIVTVSREAIAAATDSESSSGSSAAVEADTMLIVEAFGRKNLRIVGRNRDKRPVPAPDSPVFVYFNVQPSSAGPVEAMVVIRQGTFPLAQLTLNVTAVETAPDTVERETAAASGTTTARPPELNQLRIVSSEDDRNLRFQYELSLPGIALSWFESKRIKGDQASYVETLYKDIEARYATTERQDEDFRLELKAMGGELFEQLFPSEMQTLLWENKDRIDSIQVISTEPFVPWELVFLKNPDQPGLPKEGKFLAELGLTRWVHKGWHPSLVRVRPGRAHYVAPDYADPKDRLTEAPAEVDFLEKRLGATPVRPASREVTTLLQDGFDLLHFVCHGEAQQSDIANAAVLLSAPAAGGGWETGELTSRKVEQIAILKGADGNQPLVVLNACQTGREGLQLTGLGGFARAFLSAGAGMFVGTLWSVVDAPARVFVTAFYEALLAGHTLGEAATFARAKSSEVEASSWLAYAVYGDPRARLVLGDPAVAGLVVRTPDGTG